MATKSKLEILLLKKRPSNLSDYKIVADTRVNDTTDIQDSLRVNFRLDEELDRPEPGRE